MKRKLKPYTQCQYNDTKHLYRHNHCNGKRVERIPNFLKQQKRHVFMVSKKPIRYVISHYSPLTNTIITVQGIRSTRK